MIEQSLSVLCSACLLQPYSMFTVSAVILLRQTHPFKDAINQRLTFYKLITLISSQLPRTPWSRSFLTAPQPDASPSSRHSAVLCRRAASSGVHGPAAHQTPAAVSAVRQGQSSPPACGFYIRTERPSRVRKTEKSTPDTSKGVFALPG